MDSSCYGHSSQEPGGDLMHILVLFGTSTSAAAQRATLLFLVELIRRIHHFSAATLK